MFFRNRSELRPTPLRRCSALASRLGLRDVLIKDESERFGLNSFKIVGVLYAVDHLWKHGRLSEDSVLVCATEGNHGIAVARAARMYGLTAKIYISSDTSASRLEALRQEGAQVIIVNGSYDVAVRRSARDAKNAGWTIISDTSWPGYEEVPQLIMAGYTRILDEAESAWGDKPPGVVILQAGVGSLACAVLNQLCLRYGARRPFTIICEPESAACFLESARTGRRASIKGPFRTIMAGLRCGVVSPVAWQVISKAADAFVSVSDDYCVAAMRALGLPKDRDCVISAGASGACGLAALLSILQEKELLAVRQASVLGENTEVFLINTEGITDPELYSRVIDSDQQ